MFKVTTSGLAFPHAQIGGDELWSLLLQSLNCLASTVRRCAVLLKHVPTGNATHDWQHSASSAKPRGSRPICRLWPPNSPDLNPVDYRIWAWML